LSAANSLPLSAHPAPGKALFCTFSGCSTVRAKARCVSKARICFNEFRNRRIGFVFQFHHLLPEFTALENACMPALIQRREPQEVRQEAIGLLKDVGLGPRLQHKPGELSGGEQQRVAVARALLQKPDLVLADEPTGNLDTHTGDALFALMRELNKARGTTFVIVTHNDKLSAQADRILHMQDGQII
jgi:lipoprotein-releasing system ATP-binding protein